MWLETEVPAVKVDIHRVARLVRGMEQVRIVVG